jgi:hypothetical protein
MSRRIVLTTSHLFGGLGGGGFVGFPRAWLRSSSIKYFKKLPDLFGSAAAMSASTVLANGTWAPVSRTGCLSRAQRIVRISAMPDVFDGTVDPAHTSVESWAPEDLLGMGSQRRVGDDGEWGVDILERPGGAGNQSAHVCRRGRAACTCLEIQINCPKDTAPCHLGLGISACGCRIAMLGMMITLEMVASPDLQCSTQRR